MALLEAARQQRHHHVTRAHAHAAVHGDSPAGRVNKWLAIRITKAVGSMWCAYGFAVLALISLPSVVRQHDVVTLVAWVAQTFLQLVLLSIIIVGQQVLAEASDQRAEADHESIELLRQINVQQLEILEENTRLTEEIHGLTLQVHEDRMHAG